MKLLHKIIFWSHLLAGTIGGVVIFIMSATGFMVMYERQLVEFAERDVRQVAQPGAGAQRLSLDELVAKVREQNPKAQVTGDVIAQRADRRRGRRLRPRRRHLCQPL